ncbi:MAG: sensor histidine kinase [bacterium JZ-2024 1]
MSVIVALAVGVGAGWLLAHRIYQAQISRLFRRVAPRGLIDIASAFARETEEAATLRKSLHQAHAFLQSLVDHIPIGVILLDSEARVTHINDRATAIVGSRMAPLGRFQWEVIRSADLASDIQKARKSSGRLQSTYTASQGLGAEFVRATIVPLPPPSGGLAVFLEDIKPEEEYRRRKEDMIQAISHELKTPVTVISGYAELLWDAVPDESLRTEIVRPLQQAVDALKNLLSDVMTLYRLESTPPPAFERVSLQKIVSEVDALLGPEARRRQITLTWDITRPDPILYGNPADLFQMLLNLVQNAIIYNRPNGSVTVSARKDGSRLLLEVRDTGIGISSHDMPRIFERFYRAEKGRSRENGGTGLGLAIVKHVVERHSGEIKVESRLGEGSTFRVFLPLTVLDRKPESISRPESASSAS